MGDDPKRSELALEGQALRNDWPIPPAVRVRILQRLIDYLDRDHEEGATAPDRTVLRAAEVLAQFAGLTLKQQSIDLARQKLEGRPEEMSLAELVGEAEKRAEERRRERADERGAEPGRIREAPGP